MNWSLILARAARAILKLVLAAVLYWYLRQADFYRFTAHEAEGLNTVILLVGSIYAVMYAFVIFVIWSQFTEVENFIMRECNSLNDLLRFGEHLNPDASRQLRRAVEDYVHGVLKGEWQSLSARRRNRQTEKDFSDLMGVVIGMTPANPPEEAMHQRLIDIVRRAGEHRDERITKSLTRIPPTLVRLVGTTAGALQLLIFVYPFHHWLTGICCFVLVSVVFFLADLVMEDTDNPFEGVCNVSPAPFADLVRT